MPVVVILRCYCLTLYDYTLLRCLGFVLLLLLHVVPVVSLVITGVGVDYNCTVRCCAHPFVDYV